MSFFSYKLINDDYIFRIFLQGILATAAFGAYHYYCVHMPIQTLLAEQKRLSERLEEKRKWWW